VEESLNPVEQNLLWNWKREAMNGFAKSTNLVYQRNEITRLKGLNYG
jgi:transposase-like protein